MRNGKDTKRGHAPVLFRFGGKVRLGFRDTSIPSSRRGYAVVRSGRVAVEVPEERITEMARGYDNGGHRTS